MVVKNIDQFIAATEFHVQQLINLATELEGSPEVPGVILAIYYLQKSIEESTKIQERMKNGKNPETETGAKESTPSGDGTSSPRSKEVRTSKRGTSDVESSE